jgi:purine nucleoside phosphorylase
MEAILKEIERAADYIFKQIKEKTSIGIILGTGLGGLVEQDGVDLFRRTIGEPPAAGPLGVRQVRETALGLDLLELVRSG